MELSSPKLKKLIFQGELPKPEKEKCHIFCLRKLSKHKCKRKSFLYFSYKEIKFSQLKYFLMIIIKRFFSFYNIFFYTQPQFNFFIF